jgi:NADPH:quinone reductase-like Zn-dependent oxidoreductase
MKAVICSKYGGPEVLSVENIEKPELSESEMLVKVQSASVTRADCMMRAGTPFYARFFLGLTKPKRKVPGTGFAGTVEEMGKRTTQFKIGDKVFGETGVNFGANAEYLAIADQDVVNQMPNGMSYEEAATVCDGPLTSMNFLKNIGEVKEGDRVLIIGASGSLGTAGVQIAKAFGANVTGVCSTDNVELVQSLGADDVIDYKKADFSTSGREWDIIYDTIGKSSYNHSKPSLSERGVYICPVIGISLLASMIFTSIRGKKRARFSATGMLPVDQQKKLLSELLLLFQEKKLKSVMDRFYRIEETADAHRYIETGRKKGNVVIQLEEPEGGQDQK